MDKRVIIAAYRKGILTREQCAQMLGIDSEPLLGLVSGEAERLLRPADLGGSRAGERIPAAGKRMIRSGARRLFDRWRATNHDS